MSPGGVEDGPWLPGLLLPWRFTEQVAAGAAGLVVRVVAPPLSYGHFPRSRVNTRAVVEYRQIRKTARGGSDTVDSFAGLNMGLGALPLMSNARTRSISGENPTGAKGIGGMAGAGSGGCSVVGFVAGAEVGSGSEVAALGSHDKVVDFVIPKVAFSATTMVAMSIAAIYPDYYSRLRYLPCHRLTILDFWLTC